MCSPASITHSHIGSVAHGVAQDGDPSNTIYGFRTWTNGPIAVSYLAGLLEVPLAVDYAYGHASGGSKFGATIDNSYTKSDANAPSSKDQIANYTSSTEFAHVSDALHFLWIGANDINLYHLWTDNPSYPSFAKDFSALLTGQVKSLLDAGAPFIFVPNLYAKHLSRSSEFYADTPEKVANLGSIIQEANAAIASSLAQFGDRVIVYDVFSRMVEIWNNHDNYGINYIDKHMCDGGGDADWDICVTQGRGGEFYWMQFLDMTSHVHQLIAEDMANVIKAKFN